MQTRLIAGFSALAFVMAGADADAQNLTIQQPVLSGFSVGTTVSVPDRGGALLGGVSRAGSTRTDFGPLGLGGTTSVFQDQSNVTTHVWIHDFAAMDRAVLDQSPVRGAAGAASYSGPRPLTGQAARAYRQLMMHHSNPVNSGRLPSLSETILGSRPDATLPQTGFARRGNRLRTDNPASEEHEAAAARSYRLGIQAEQRGAIGVARLHYRLAAKRGSVPAAARLGKWNSELAAPSQAASASVAGSSR